MRHGFLSDKLYELMAQAIAECNPDDHPSKGKTLQRFAELIIEECKEAGNLALTDEYDGFVPSQMIDKHFGVE